MPGIKLLVSAFLAVALGLSSVAQARQMQVQDAAVGTHIAQRSAQGTADQFPSSVGQLYAFTRIVGGAPGSYVTHKWYYGQQLMAEVRLRVGADSWRTWSSKKVMDEWTGQWRVEIVADDGTTLDSITFFVG